MAERRQKRADRAMRPTLRSAGRPPPRRKVERELWRRIAGGLTSEDAAAAVGVSGPVGTRWFRHGGGMSPISLAEPSGRYLSFAEREEIALLRAQDYGVREIARRIGRDASTISPELRRNAATRASQRGYRASVAQLEGRAGCQASQDRQARRQPLAAGLCPRPTVWEGQASRRNRVLWSDRAGVEGPEQAAPAGPAVGHGVESGADQPPAGGRLPKGRVHANQPRGHLPGALRARRP